MQRREGGSGGSGNGAFEARWAGGRGDEVDPGSVWVGAVATEDTCGFFGILGSSSDTNTVVP